MSEKNQKKQTNTARWSQEIVRLLAEPKSPELPPKVIDDFEVPKWWECVWRRNRCNLRTCRFCTMMWAGEAETSAYIGELVRDEELSNETGRQNPNDIVVEDDAPEITDEDWEEMRANEPPDADTFRIYRHIMFWLNPLVRYIYPRELREEPWTKTEAAKDLLWYATLLPSKVYRQLSTKWEVARKRDDEYEQEFGRIETGYTGYVIRECVSTIEQSLILLTKEGTQPLLEPVLQEFRRLKPSILALSPKSRPRPNG